MREIGSRPPSHHPRSGWGDLVTHHFRAHLGLLVALCLLPFAALAELDVQDVSFVRGVDRVGGGTSDESAYAEVVVVGNGITSVSLTLPDLSSVALAQVTPREFSVQLSFSDEADLDAGFPAGSYDLDLNSGARLVEVILLPPAVTPPAITSPAHGSNNNSPTTTDFVWSGCASDTCGADTDHVFTEITSTGTVAANAFLEAGSSSWRPPELDEDADFTFFVDNVAYRVAFQITYKGTITHQGDGDPCPLRTDVPQGDARLRQAPAGPGGRR